MKRLKRASQSQGTRQGQALRQEKTSSLLEKHEAPIREMVSKGEHDSRRKCRDKQNKRGKVLQVTENHICQDDYRFYFNYNKLDETW